MKRLLLQLVMLATLGLCLGVLAMRATRLVEGDSSGAGKPHAASRTAPAADMAALDPVVRPSLSDFPETLSRPVFFSGRAFPRPQPKSDPLAGGSGPARVAGNVDNLKLWGVLIEASTRKALLVGASGKARWFSVGERIDQWTVKEIAEVHVTLSAPGREAVLRLYRDSSRL